MKNRLIRSCLRKCAWTHALRKLLCPHTLPLPEINKDNQASKQLGIPSHESSESTSSCGHTNGSPDPFTFAQETPTTHGDTGREGPGILTKLSSLWVCVANGIWAAGTFVLCYCPQDIPAAQLVKNLPAMWETWVWSLAWEVPLEKGMTTHSSILACRNPWTEKTGRLQSMGSQRVGYGWATNMTTTGPKGRSIGESHGKPFKFKVPGSSLTQPDLTVLEGGELVTLYLRVPR